MAPSWTADIEDESAEIGDEVNEPEIETPIAETRIKAASFENEETLSLLASACIADTEDESADNGALVALTAETLNFEASSERARLAPSEETYVYLQFPSESLPLVPIVMTAGSTETSVFQNHKSFLSRFISLMLPFAIYDSFNEREISLQLVPSQRIDIASTALSPVESVKVPLAFLKLDGQVTNREPLPS